MHTLKQVLNAMRSGGTQRFHTHAARMIKTQDVAQHSYNVVWLVQMLTKGAASKALILHALAHDAGEHWVGDVPAPTKRSLGIRDQLGAEEDRVIHAMMGWRLGGLPHHEQVLLKLCDSMEGALYCCREMEMGNTQMAGILENFVDYVDEIALNHLDTLGDESVFDASLFEALIAYARSFLKGFRHVS